MSYVSYDPGWVQHGVTDLLRVQSVGQRSYSGSLKVLRVVMKMKVIRCDVIFQVAHAGADAGKLSGEGGSVSVTLTAPCTTPAVLTTGRTAVRHAARPRFYSKQIF